MRFKEIYSADNLEQAIEEWINEVNPIIEKVHYQSNEHGSSVLIEYSLPAPIQSRKSNE